MTTESQEVKNYVTPEVKANIGKEGLPATWIEPLDRSSLRRYVMGTQDRNPLYSDEELAKKSRYGGLIAPPFYLAGLALAFGQRLTEVVGEEREGGPGHARPGGTPAVRIEGLARGVNGGNETEWFRPVHLGDTLTWKSRIADIFQRTGRTGPLVMTVTETEYRNQRGELVALSRQTGIRMQ